MAGDVAACNAGSHGKRARGPDSASIVLRFVFSYGAVRHAGATVIAIDGATITDSRYIVTKYAIVHRQNTTAIYLNSAACVRVAIGNYQVVDREPSVLLHMEDTGIALPLIMKSPPSITMMDLCELLP